MNPIEQLRTQAINSIFKMSSIQKVWPLWQKDINKLISNSTPNATELQSIGNNLHDIFKSTSSGRSQSTVSGGGAAWEGFVCWYLNLCLIGSRTVVIKSNKSLTPSFVSDSITVKYGNFASNTESDLLAITFPKLCHESDQQFQKLSGLTSYLNQTIIDNTSDTELTVIQCKTNWNDNAQIPMLWDLIYRSEGFTSDVATVGQNGAQHSSYSKFKYAFVTVPTVDHTKFKPTSTAVMRLKNLSAGNYWGLPQSTGIAGNVFDLITNNFHSSLDSYNGTWIANIQSEILSVINTDDYFNLKVPSEGLDNV